MFFPDGRSGYNHQPKLPGKHNVIAQAEDTAGQVSSASAEYTVKVTLQSLINLIQQWITGPGADGLVNSLLTKLMLGQHEAFNNEVLAHKGVKLGKEQADSFQFVRILEFISFWGGGED